MTLLRRLFVISSVAGIAAAATAAPATGANEQNDNVDFVARLSAEANAALMRGDMDAYRRLITLSDDFSFMSPFGGQAAHRSAFTEERMDAIGGFFRNGSFAQEVVQSYASGDLVVLVVIERARVEVGGLPAQDWPLRVTLVYRRVGAQWQLAHRHADPLYEAISLEEAAALASRASE